MTTIMELSVRLVADISAYTKAMGQAQDKAKETANRVGSDLRELGSRFTSAGQTMSAAITLPVAAAGWAAVQAASDLNETKNQVQVVFGSMSQSVLNWSQNSARAFGQSQNDALNAASSLGSLLITMGQGQKAASDMSMRMAQLASDMASFKNTSPAEALAAIQSALIGESEPIRKYNVLLTEAAMKQKAMEMGLVGVGDQLTEGQKVLARYAIIMDQTRLMQGDFANTAEGAANQMRIFRAQAANAWGMFGQIMLPYALKAIQYFNDLLVKVNALSPEMQKFVIVGAGIAAAIGPALIIIGQIISAIGAIVPVVTAVAGVLSGPVVLAIVAAVGLVALLAAAWINNWGNIRSVVAGVMTWMQERISIGMQLISLYWTTYGMPMVQRAREIWNGIAAALKPAWDWILSIVADGWHWINNWWRQHGLSIHLIWKNLWAGVGSVLGAAWEVIKAIFSAGVALVQAIWARHGDAITKVFTNTWEMIKNTFKGYMDAFGFILDAFAAAFRGDWRKFGEDLRKAWDALWAMMVKNLKLAWDNIKVVFGEWWRNIKDFFTKLDMKAIGKAIIDGLISGLLSAAPKIDATIAKMGKAIMDAFKGFFQIKSPARLPRIEAGQPIGQGLEFGVVDSVQAFVRRIPNIMKGVVPALASVPAMAGSFPAVSSPGLAGAGGGGVNVTVPVRSMIVDKYQIQNELAPYIIAEIREYLNK